MTDPAADDHAEIRSVGRALDLLDMMQRAAPAGIRVRDAASHLGVDPATASRLLATLITRGYATRMPNRSYTLGARSLRLASGWIDRLLQVAAQPMTRIANSCGETVYLLQLVGTEAVTLARLAGTRRVMIDVEVGPSYPLWATAAGRALLGTLPWTQAPGLLPPEPFPAFTPRTKTRWADVSAAIAEGAASACMPRRARSIRFSAVTPFRCWTTAVTRNWRLPSASSCGARRATGGPSSRRCGGNGGNSLGGSRARSEKGLLRTRR
jgi:IclR family transcriptional regulator, acetate operon repressor